MSSHPLLHFYAAGGNEVLRRYVRDHDEWTDEFRNGLVAWMKFADGYQAVGNNEQQDPAKQPQKQLAVYPGAQLKASHAHGDDDCAVHRNRNL